MTPVQPISGSLLLCWHLALSLGVGTEDQNKAKQDPQQVRCDTDTDGRQSKDMTP